MSELATCVDQTSYPSILENPDILLLDEPTNHLDAQSVAWLERYLAEFKGTVVLP